MPKRSNPQVISSVFALDAVLLLSCFPSGFALGVGGTAFRAGFSKNEEVNMGGPPVFLLALR